jgi:hypothetical protein
MKLIHFFPSSGNFIPLNSTRRCLIKQAKSHGIVKDYRLTVERRSARSRELCRWECELLVRPPMSDRSKRVGATQNVVPGPPAWGMGVGLTTPTRKKYCYVIMEETKIHTQGCSISKAEIMWHTRTGKCVNKGICYRNDSHR